MAGRGPVRHGEARRGVDKARPGMAELGRGTAWASWGSDTAWRGKARRVPGRCGVARMRWGMAGRGKAGWGEAG